MHNTPRSNRLHIALIGRRNAGKSSLLNALTGQDTALVSPTAGTTTDPVYKAAELLPLGPVEWVDTAGIDDEGELGQQRVKRTNRVLEQADMALLVTDLTTGGIHADGWLQEKLKGMQDLQIPCIIVETKCDLVNGISMDHEALKVQFDTPIIRVSAKSGTGIDDLKDAIVAAGPHEALPNSIVGDLVQPGDTVVMVTPIDNETPQGRLILPQVQTLRDLLDHGVQVMVTRDSELQEALASLCHPPDLVITDSQVFDKVAQFLPPQTPLTSFSILFARYKGDLKMLVAGLKAVASLQPGDPVLIAEACTHRPVGEDIGRVKIPALLTKKIGGAPSFTWCNGNDFPTNLDDYKLVIHCGGCMIQAREMRRRLKQIATSNVPVVNYGVLLAHLHGALPKAIAPFGLAHP